VGPVALAYTFGLRHALDADHIAAIDNVGYPLALADLQVCRKLVALGQTPGTVGTFFRYSNGKNDVELAWATLLSLSS